MFGFQKLFRKFSRKGIHLLSMNGFVGNNLDLSKVDLSLILPTYSSPLSEAREQSSSDKVASEQQNQQDKKKLLKFPKVSLPPSPEAKESESRRKRDPGNEVVIRTR